MGLLEQMASLGLGPTHAPLGARREWQVLPTERLDGGGASGLLVRRLGSTEERPVTAATLEQKRVLWQHTCEDDGLDDTTPSLVRDGRGNRCGEPGKPTPRRERANPQKPASKRTNRGRDQPDAAPAAAPAPVAHVAAPAPVAASAPATVAGIASAVLLGASAHLSSIRISTRRFFARAASSRPSTAGRYSL